MCRTKPRLGFLREASKTRTEDGGSDAAQSTRLVLWVCVELQWAPVKGDAARAFLQSGKLRQFKREVFLRPPPEAGVPPHLIWKARRAIYGFDDGPFEWTLELYGHLIAEDFRRLESDLAIWSSLSGTCRRQYTASSTRIRTIYFGEEMMSCGRRWSA